MPTSVGVISLDFVIKDKILPQIEKITAQAQSSAGKLGGAVSKAVEEPLNSIGKRLRNPLIKPWSRSRK